MVWTLDHAEAEMWKIPPDPTLEAVARLVSADNREWTGSPSELAETLNDGMAANILTKHLNVNASRLMDEYNIRYENKPKHSGRKITLTYIVVDVVIM